MKILVSPDSFKETLTAKQACEAMHEGIKEVYPKAETTFVPLADGGEGTVEALVSATNGRLINTQARDPLGKRINSFYGVDGLNRAIFIEMAAASGFGLLSKEQRNPLNTSTKGTGDLIKDALDKGYKHFIIGLGGSATNDGGAGMLEALGLKLFTQEGLSVNPVGGNLGKVTKIDTSCLHPMISVSKFTIANDVNNPLTGKNGSSTIYGPQKGANPEMVELLDKNLTHWGLLLEKTTGRKISTIPGAGAAGGLSAAFLAFFNSELIPGFEVISKVSSLEERVKESDLIITGEGKVDSQTLNGKTVSGVLNLAKKYDKPVIVAGGVVTPEVEDLQSEKVKLVSMSERAGSSDEAVKRPHYWLKETIKTINKVLEYK